MKALVLTQLTGNEPTVLRVGENCDGYTRVATVDDYGVFVVAGSAAQIAALGLTALVEDVNWLQPISAGTAEVLNALLVSGGYDPLPAGISLCQGMVAMLGTFEPELYDVGESAVEPTREVVVPKKRHKKAI